MTHKPTVQNPPDDEIFYDTIQFNTHRIQEIDRVISYLKARKNELEAFVESDTQSVIRHFQAMGLVENERFKLSESTMVDAPDFSAVPEEYIRTKRELDKAKIRSQNPQGSWYTIQSTPTLKIK